MGGPPCVRASDHDRRVPVATQIEGATSILGLTDKLPLAYAVRELNPREGCAPQILDRRCSDRLNASGIRYGMIGA